MNFMMWNSYKILSLCLKSPNPRCLSFQNDLVTVVRQDALQHLMNYVWPNVFENSPHLIMAQRWVNDS